jgi:hypothetical protein
MVSIRTAVLALATVLLVAAYVIVDTRIGAYLVLDVVGAIGDEEPDYDAENGPLVLSGELEPVMEIALPEDIEQPSGIQHRGDRVYISTDQAELFVLDDQFQAWTERAELIGGFLLLKQGALEGIEVIDDTLLAIGEFGAIPVWEREDGTWRRRADEALPEDIPDDEYSGITFFQGQRYAASEESPVIVNLDTGMVHELDFGSLLKAGQDVSSLMFSGLASDAGRLFVLTESHSSILVVDPRDFSVLAVYAIRPGPVQDMAVREGRAYVVVDHNLDEPRPPLYVYDLSMASTTSVN